jgi:hypothetical protein
VIKVPGIIKKERVVGMPGEGSPGEGEFGEDEEEGEGEGEGEGDEDDEESGRNDGWYADER